MTAEDTALLERVDAGFDRIGELIESSKFKAALNDALALAREVNQYLSDEAPWAKLENERERAGTILYTALRAIDSLKILMTPFMPHSSQRLHELLGYEGWIAGPARVPRGRGGRRAHALGPHRRLRHVDRTLGAERSSSRPETARAEQLFTKLDPEIVVAEEIARLEAAAQAA